MQVTQFKAFSIVAALFLATGSAHAAPNFITNGSFESGLSGWTQGGTPIVTSPSTYPVVAITYGPGAQYPMGAFGEAVAAPNDATMSPDAAGTRGAYFVDDNAVNQSLSQLVFLAAGSYRIGFDVYAPQNGFNNAGDASFSAQIAGVSLANYLVSTRPSVTWTNISALVTIANAGFYSSAFVFNTSGGVSKDIVIDRVFIVASTETGGRVIPEPGSLALFGIALVGLAAARKRRAA